MASVTQCDACDKIVSNEDSYYLKLYTCNSKGEPSTLLYKKDICPECKRKLMMAFEIEEEQ